MAEFGRLESVDLRKAWRDEAQVFTPWLAKNLERLSEVIGIPLEAQDTEVSVEQFSADILARNPQDNTLVLIENQLTRSDHDHLGKVLTYLAGLEAQTIVWIASEFTNPHLSAVRWLNDHTADSHAFFAVQARVVKIGSSPLVPIFDVLERPNEWDRQVRAKQEASAMSGNSKLRHDFWVFYRQHYPNSPQVRAGHRDSNTFVHVGDLTISPYISLRGVGIYVRDRDRSHTAEQSQLVHRCRDIIQERGIETWRPIELANPDNWPTMASWLHDRLLEFHDVIDAVSTPPDVSELEVETC